MNTGLTIAGTVIVGLLFLFLILGLVYSRVRKHLEMIVTEKFKKEEVLGATTRANFLGVASRRGVEVRGNGAIVLTRDAFFFFRAVPAKEYSVPIDSIKKVSMPKSFNGRSVMRPLLCLHYSTDSGEDAMAFALQDPGKWKEAIEALTS